jgi:hypothetical protein
MCDIFNRHVLLIFKDLGQKYSLGSYTTDAGLIFASFKHNLHRASSFEIEISFLNDADRPSVFHAKYSLYSAGKTLLITAVNAFH